MVSGDACLVLTTTSYTFSEHSLRLLTTISRIFVNNQSAMRMFIASSVTSRLTSLLHVPCLLIVECLHRGLNAFRAKTAPDSSSTETGHQQNTSTCMSTTIVCLVSQHNLCFCHICVIIVRFKRHFHKIISLTAKKLTLFSRVFLGIEL